MHRIKKSKIYQSYSRHIPLGIAGVIFAISFAIYLGGIAMYLAGCELFNWAEDRAYVVNIYYSTPFISALTVIGSFVALVKNIKQLLIALPLLNASVSILYIIVIYGTYDHYTLNDVLNTECSGWRTAENPTIYE
jgi:hypothetical protein